MKIFRRDVRCLILMKLKIIHISFNLKYNIIEAEMLSCYSVLTGCTANTNTMYAIYEISRVCMHLVSQKVLNPCLRGRNT